MTTITANDFKLINATSENIAKLNEALAYLQKSAAATQILQDMVDHQVNIRFVPMAAEYHLEASKARTEDTPVMSRTAGDKQGFPANTIDWSPDAMLMYTDARHSNAQMSFDGEDEYVKEMGMLSPALMLIHEGGHAIDPDYLKHLHTANRQYGDAAERHAGVEAENKSANKLNEGIRENHGGVWVRLPSGASPTLHTVRNDHSDELEWQAQYLDGAIEVTGGKFVKNFLNPTEKDHYVENIIPDLGHYDPPSKTFTVNHATVTLDQRASGLTVKGEISTLNMPDNIRIVTEGNLKLHHGKEMQAVQGRVQVDVHDGKMTMTPLESSQDKAQSASADYHKLADTFQRTIRTMNKDDPRLAALAQSHEPLLGSLAFYYGMKDRVPEVTAQRIGDNLVGAIRAGQPLPPPQITETIVLQNMSRHEPVATPN